MDGGEEWTKEALHEFVDQRVEWEKTPLAWQYLLLLYMEAFKRLKRKTE